MGGYGSSRWGGHSRRRCIGEGTLELPVSSFSGIPTAATMTELRLQWGNVLSLRAIAGKVKEDWPGGDSMTRLLQLEDKTRERVGSVSLVGDRAPFGGVRWWISCPECGQKRRALYYLTASCYSQAYMEARGQRVPFRWQCRKCARLFYRSQKLTPLDGLQYRGCKIAARMGHGEMWYPNNTGSPPKPKGMHWRTWTRYNEQLDAVESRRNQVWIGQVSGFMARTTKQLARFK